jgi:hypothetical protein
LRPSPPQASSDATARVTAAEPARRIAGTVYVARASR